MHGLISLMHVVPDMEHKRKDMKMLLGNNSSINNSNSRHHVFHKVHVTILIINKVEQQSCVISQRKESVRAALL